MKTIILSGGFGTRLKEETEFKPKPMVFVGDKPILWHIMKIYSHHGFNDFIVALGYKGETIKDYFINHKHLAHDFTINIKSGQTTFHRKRSKSTDNFRITFVDTGLETLTGERVLRVKNHIKEQQFMVTYGDGVSDINIKEVVKFHNTQRGKHGCIGTVTGVHPRSRWGLVKTNKNNLVVEFRQKPILNEYVNGGFMVFEREFLNYLKEGMMIEGALEQLAAEGKLGLYFHNGFWHAMDTYKDVEDLNKMWEGEPEWKIWE